MKKLSLILFAISIFFFVNAVQAQQNNKTFLLRITSAQNPSQAIPFIGSYLVITDKDSQFYQLKGKTPSEAKVSAKIVNFMLQTNNKNPKIKVELLESNNKTPKEIGIGHAIIVFSGAPSKPRFILAN